MGEKRRRLHSAMGIGLGAGLLWAAVACRWGGGTVGGGRGEGGGKEAREFTWAVGAEKGASNGGRSNSACPSKVLGTLGWGQDCCQHWWLIGQVGWARGRGRG